MHLELQDANRDATILVVDDNSEIRQLLTEILQDTGYVALPAENGKVALEVLTAHTVDLILLDILMPDLNGVATLSAIWVQSDVPVMMFSAVSNAILPAELTQLGIAAYVTQPFRLQVLLDTIKIVLQGPQLAHDFGMVHSAMTLKGD